MLTKAVNCFGDSLWDKALPFLAGYVYPAAYAHLYVNNKNLATDDASVVAEYNTELNLYHSMLNSLAGSTSSSS